MASTCEGLNPHSYGGRRNSSGRNKIFNSSSSRTREREKSRRRIRLEENTYQSWLQAELEAGYSSFSDGEFAVHSLSSGYRRR